MKLREEISVMNKKMDLSGVNKKVDSNIEAAREQYRLDDEKKL
jgi:3-polyprenyl-4-hydroxybenzoate decarboxylase